MKKKLSLIMSVIMLITTLSALQVNADFSDVPEGNQYRNAILTLSKLKTSEDKPIINGYEDGTFKPSGAITRAEFAKIMVSVLNYTNMGSAAHGFNDIDEHWAKNEIGICANFGIINGMGDGTFRPDAPVTYEQAVKMVVCTLGYGSIAEGLGGYPTGYTSKANDLRLLNGIESLSFKDNAPRGVVAKLVYNALEVNMAETSAAGTVSTTDKTLLENHLNVKKLKGTVAGIEDYTTDLCTTSLSKGFMDVIGNDGEEYIMSYLSYTQDITMIRNLLGKAVTLYYRQAKETDGMELVIIDDETSKNDVIKIMSDKLYSYDGSTLKYYNEKDELKSFKADAKEGTVRYNGKRVAITDRVKLRDSMGTETEVSALDAMKEWLNPESKYFIYGDVSLVDNGADGSIDLIEIFNYETLVALSKPTASDYRIQDKIKTATYLILNPESSSYSYTITKNGASIETTAVAANDILLYATSLDGTIYTVYDTANTVTGTISKMSDNFSKVTINNQEYKISDACKKYLSDTAGIELKLNINGTFYLDMYDTIAFAAISAETEIPYAYIASATIDPADNAGYLMAYLPTSSASGAKSYPMETKVRVNGSSMTADKAVNTLKAAAANSNKDADKAAQIYGANKTPILNDVSQIAKIKLNSSNKVSEIITLSDDTYDENGQLAENVRNEDTSKLVRYHSLGKYYYSSSSFKEAANSSNTLFTTNSSTKVLYVPMDRNDRSAYANKTVSSAFTTGESYYVEAYNVNSSKIAGLVVMYGSNGALTKVTKSTDFSVVATEPESVYSEATEQTTLQFDVYKGAVNTTASWSAYDKDEFSDIAVGDVIQFAYDNDKLAQERVNNIRFEDIREVLDKSIDSIGEGDVLYNWDVPQTPSKNNNYQSSLFDYRFKKVDSNDEPVWNSGEDKYEDEEYTSSSIGSVPYLRAYMANVSQVLLEENKLYLMKSGFTKQDGEWTYDESDYEELSVSSSTKIIRMDKNRKGFDRYVEDTTTDLSYTDLRDAKNYGINCSKVLVCTLRGAVRMIVIYG